MQKTDYVKFSVIIPLYNKEKYIANTLDSVLKQTEPDFEIIVVDDGSSDKSAEVVTSIPDDRIRLIRQPNSGVSAARNNGIRNSRGEYICFLDADDLWFPDFLETVEHLYVKYPQANIACPSYQVNYGNRIHRPKWKSVNEEPDSLVNDFLEMATSPFWICNSSCFSVRRKAILKEKTWFPENETVYEDFDLWIRLGYTNTVAHSKKICSVYNRITDKNARKTHVSKVVYSKTYMSTLDRILSSDDVSSQRKQYVKIIKDRRMVPYVFSLLLRNDKKEARQILKTWDVSKEYQTYKRLLTLATFSPGWMINTVQELRYQLF